MNFDKVIRMIYANEYTTNQDAYEIFNELGTADYVDAPVNQISSINIDNTHAAYNDAENFYQTMVNYFSSLHQNPGNQLTEAEMNGFTDTNPVNPVDLDNPDRVVNEISFFIKLKGDALGTSGDTNNPVHQLGNGKIIKIILSKPL
jgi:hypothetical protein